MWFPRLAAAATLFIAIIALLVAPLAARTFVGGFATWAAFCDGPRACFAIATPDSSDRRGYLTVAFGRGEVQFHLDRPVRAVTGSISGRTFVLAPKGEMAAADDATSQRIVAAMAASYTITVAGIDARGRRFHQRYPLAGALSAIDAAALAAMR